VDDENKTGRHKFLAMRKARKISQMKVAAELREMMTSEKEKEAGVP